MLSTYCQINPATYELHNNQLILISWFIILKIHVLGKIFGIWQFTTIVSMISLHYLLTIIQKFIFFYDNHLLNIEII